MSSFKVSRLEWRQGFSVGIPVIDEQHRGMIEALNEIGLSLAQDDREGCERLFTKFLELSRRHFTSEERVLFASNYPKAMEHAQHHKILLSAAEEARETCRKLLQSRQMSECFDSLLEFLISDLLEADIQFKSYLEEMDQRDRRALDERLAARTG